MNGSLFDWLANLPFVTVLAIAVALYAIYAFLIRAFHLERVKAAPVTRGSFRASAGTRTVSTVPDQEPSRFGQGLVEFVESLLFAWVVVFLILKPFFLQAFYIPSESMVPTLQVHDRLLVAKFPYWFRGPQRGEIIVFKAPPNADKDGIERDYIKRLIGMPGEKLEVRAGKVLINDHALDEPYTEEPSERDYGPIIVPQNHYFMMGDNRNRSADSRYWGPLDRKRIVGKAWFRFWPLDKIGFLPTPPYDVTQKPQPALGIPALVH